MLLILSKSSELQMVHLKKITIRELFLNLDDEVDWFRVVKE